MKVSAGQGGGNETDGEWVTYTHARAAVILLDLLLR